MTNERAKEVLQEQIDRYGQEYDAEGIEAINKAIEVLEQTRWTPATQLPPSYEAVLLYVKYKSSRQHTYQLGMWNANKQSWEDWRTPYQLEEEFEVIAWMELPEIYEEDNNEW